MKGKKKLPIGIQDFEKLREAGYHYVDKTKEIYELITQGGLYFLSRPRRFGKSLLVSTLAALFAGKRHLFQGLWIDTSDYIWNSHPVIQLDLSRVSSSSPEVLSLELADQLSRMSRKFDIPDSDEFSLGYRFGTLIEHLSQLNKVVVLIDEYDKPILDQISSSEVVSQNREILRQFYGVLKSQDHNIHFVLLTGVSKFTKISVFSELNNLNDISLSGKYATLLGYTHEELISNFEYEIEQVAESEEQPIDATQEKIKHWYNGYRFSNRDVRVYNPFSTLLLFDHLLFSNHWFETGTPGFLLKLVEEQKYNISELEDLKVNASAFSSFSVDNIQVLPLLYQSGYVTIKDYDPKIQFYTLGYPNLEVERSFLDAFLRYFAHLNAGIQSSFIQKLVFHLQRNDFEQFFNTLTTLFANIPYDFHVKNERYYQTLFYLVFMLLGLTLDAEVRTNIGRIDFVIETAKQVFIFEFKIDESAGQALLQIKERNYSQKYAESKKELYLLGVNFSSRTKNIDDWKVEKL